MNSPQYVFQDGTPVLWDAKGGVARASVEANWYEGSRWSPHRQWVWFPLQTAKRDLDRFTRYELNKKGEYLWKNSCLIRGLIERLVNLVVGSGIHPTPISSDKGFNDKSKKAWKRICRQPCADSRQHMGIHQRIIARGRFKHGECFTALTADEETYDAKIQIREGFQVTSQDIPGADMDHADQADTWPKSADGIKLNNQGMPVAYKFRGVQDPLPAQFVVHHFTPMRPEQPRGETILSSAINTAQDVDDILALEKQAVKEASGRKDVIKTPSGERDPEALRKLQFGQQYPTTLALPADKTARTDYYEVKFGSESVVLRSGDEYTPYIPERPGPAWQGFMDFLSNTICLSTGLPPSILLPVPIGGTDIRRDLQIAQRVIFPWQEDIASEFQAIWEYFMQAEIENGTLGRPPEDWNAVRWQFPMQISVDRGRDGQNDREDVKLGLMHREEYHGRYGDDGDEYEIATEKEVRARRLRLSGIAENEPFKSAQDYVEWLSLDYRAMQAKGGETSDPGESDPAMAPAKRKPSPAKAG